MDYLLEVKGGFSSFIDRKNVCGSIRFQKS
ncbi:hypothetical protein LSS_22610 [Leptospira santarosai serovar Shermani str. LT 821]|uniref:Uncharacterized protein n=1 Tax=Leptospira santarosai serovar Shermani str. LT 821 TaxID=758847 RepID=A0A097ESW0_9LEPT|nr:hypothetical protein LSS_22610 [Leptospira santarosai serovar Shermani str. LT 821]